MIRGEGAKEFATSYQDGDGRMSIHVHGQQRCNIVGQYTHVGTMAAANCSEAPEAAARLRSAQAAFHTLCPVSARSSDWHAAPGCGYSHRS